MAFEEHASCKLTKADTYPIWRFMGFDQFVSVLAEGALYFCRPDRFDDRWEGVIPPMTKDLLKAEIADALAKNLDAEVAIQQIITDAERSAGFIHVNCWHINEHESDAMWKLYSHGQNRVAIQSTVGQLKKCFKGCKEKINVGEVQYIDYGLQKLPNITLVDPYLHKRKSFAHEMELRAMSWSLSNLKGSGDNRETVKAVLDQPGAPLDLKNAVQAALNRPGTSVPIDVAALITQVQVGPGAREWFIDTVATVLKWAGYADIPVVRSTLDEPPQ